MIKFLLLLNGHKSKKVIMESVKALKSHYLFDNTFDTFFDCLKTKCKVKDSDLIEGFYGKLFKIAMSVEV